MRVGFLPFPVERADVQALYKKMNHGHDYESLRATGCAVRAVSNHLESSERSAVIDTESPLYNEHPRQRTPRHNEQHTIIK